MRVVMGADSPKGREQQAAELLHSGARGSFDTVQVLQKGQSQHRASAGTAIKSRINCGPFLVLCSAKAGSVAH